MDELLGLREDANKMKDTLETINKGVKESGQAVLEKYRLRRRIKRRYNISMRFNLK